MSRKIRGFGWRPYHAVGVIVATVAVTVLLNSRAESQTPRPVLVPPMVPELQEGAGIIRNRQIAIALGKALFWDEQAGSDGMACASCHFAAGADVRVRNQLNPGFNDANFAEAGGDTTFGSTHSDSGVLPGSMPSGDAAGPNYTLKPEDFPLHQLEDYTNRNSPLITTTNDAVSSAGAYNTDFTRVRPLGMRDKCSPADGTVFHAGRYPARQVEPRNTPTTINAAFYHSNFWDGRANNLFNGVGVFGMRDIAEDPNKRLIVLDDSGAPALGHLQIRNASLASQAVGPPLSEIEMSCSGRTFADLGRKLLFTIPLIRQKVDPADSVLGPYASPLGRGLRLQHVYGALIRQAFEPKYWSAAGRFRIVDGQLQADPFGYTQIETNFSMFWGLAIMLYEETLISDQSRFDSWFEACRPRVTPGVPGTPAGNPGIVCTAESGITDPAAYGFTTQEALGFALFTGAGNPRAVGNMACATCHGPFPNIAVPAPTPTNPAPAPPPIVLPVMSEAAYTSGQTAPFTPVERAFITDLGDGLTPLPIPTTDQRAGGMHDRGFFNVGVSPASADPGNGGFDPYGHPLSQARLFLVEQGGGTVVDSPLAITPATPANPVTLTTAINRCSGVLEPGGTPAFVGCPPPGPPGTPPPNPPPTPDPLYLPDISQERELVDGTFKTPSLRNVGLTAPYFHSGNYRDLRSVMEFYARGGSRRSKNIEDGSYTGDTTGTGPLGKGPHVQDPAQNGGQFGTNVDFFVRDLKSTDEQIDAVVAFMLTLTDKRVQCDVAPFDHPSLTITHGHKATDRSPRDGKADDIKATLPAVGAAGYAESSGYCLPNGGDLFAPGMQARVGGPKVPLN